MNAQVALQGLQVAEAGATGVAGVWFLSSVNEDVGSQMGNLTPKKYSVNISFVCRSLSVTCFVNRSRRFLKFFLSTWPNLVWSLKTSNIKQIQSDICLH